MLDVSTCAAKRIDDKGSGLRLCSPSKPVLDTLEYIFSVVILFVFLKIDRLAIRCDPDTACLQQRMELVLFMPYVCCLINSVLDSTGAKKPKESMCIILAAK